MIKPINSFPVFTVTNLSDAKKFYIENFGFTPIFENEWYIQLVSASGIQLGFLLPNQPTQPEIFHPSYNGKGVIFSFDVENVDAAYSAAKERSLNIVFDITSEDWGQRHFCVKDPNSIYLDIVQLIAPTEEYEKAYESE